MELLVQMLIIGVTTGAIYALIALGYTMVYGVIELINFAHGDVFMIGTMICIAILGILGIAPTSRPQGFALVALMIVTCLGAMLFCAILNVVIERIAYRPLRNAPRLAPLISAIGVSLILQDAGKLWRGVNYIPFPRIFPEVHYTIAPGVSISSVDILVLVIATVLMLALQWFVTYTNTGRAMRAVAQDREAAALMGVNVDRIIAVTFLIGGALAGAAAFIYGLKLGNTIFYVGFQTGLIAFTAAVLGGIGNIVGAMLGALLIGVIEALVTFIPDGSLVSIPFGLPSGGTAWTQAVIFAILILILVFRPSGLLGQQTPEKV